jgi:uncharacterized protein YciI
MYFVVFFATRYGSFSDALAQAPEVIAAHRARSQELHARGALLMSGAFLDSPPEPLSTMAVCPTREAAEEYAHGDPFVLNGMVRKRHIREWADMFAAAPRTGRKPEKPGLPAEPRSTRSGFEPRNPGGERIET